MTERRLSDVCEVIAGQSPKSSSYNKDGIGIPFFQGKADFGDKYPKVVTYCSSPIKIAEKNDVLLSVRAPVGACNLSPGKVCIGRGLSAIRPKNQKEVYYMWLFYFFQYYECILKSKGTGTTFSSITQAVIKNIHLNIPEIEKQQQTVSRIEELFSELDTGIEELKIIQEKIDIYRQSVLKETFKRCNKCKEVIFKDLLIDMRNGYGKKPTDTGKNKILKISAVRSMKLNFDECRYNDFSFSDKELIKENDLLITRYNGSRDLVGVCAVVPKIDGDYGFPDKIIRCRLKVNNSIHARFLQYYINQGEARMYIRSKIKTTSGQNGIAGSDMKKLAVHLPPLEVQREMVLYLDEKISKCDEMANNISNLIKKTEIMRHSILKQAFEGGL